MQRELAGRIKRDQSVLHTTPVNQPLPTSPSLLWAWPRPTWPAPPLHAQPRPFTGPLPVEPVLPNPMYFTPPYSPSPTQDPTLAASLTDFTSGEASGLSRATSSEPAPPHPAAPPPLQIPPLQFLPSPRPRPCSVTHRLHPWRSPASPGCRPRASSSPCCRPHPPHRPRPQS